MNPRRTVLIAIAVLAAAQLVPVSRQNPPAQGEVPASPQVREVLKRSCYDCHSNETRWPWYSRVAPVSWLVAYDVKHARRHMNFTAWDTYTDKKRAKIFDHIWEAVDEGDMPLWYYLPMHPDARLSDADRELLHQWTQAGEAKAGGAPAGGD